MGDIADYILDQAFDPWDETEEGGREYEDGFYFSDNKRCKYCGASRLRWATTGGKWRLFDAKGRVHECKRYSLSAAGTITE